MCEIFGVLPRCDGLVRCARERDPIVAGGIRGGDEPDLRKLGAQPLASSPPNGTPGKTLSAGGSGSQRGELAEVGDDTLRAAGHEIVGWEI
jgi:hypothetical protein